jgi:hypothetical protein
MRAINVKAVADQRKSEMRAHVREQFKSNRHIGLLEIDRITNLLQKGRRQLQNFAVSPLGFHVKKE